MKTLTLPADDELARALEEQADREGRPLEDLILELLRRQVVRPSPSSPRYSFIGIAHSGRNNLSTRVDELLADGADPRAGWTVSP